MRCTVRTSARHAASVLALALLGLAGCGGARKRAVPPLPLIEIAFPKGEIGAVPDDFRWTSVAGAARYRVTVGDADTFWPLILGTTTELRLPLPEGKRGAIRPGRIHEWTVEALDARGAVIASGTVRFWVAPGR